MPHTEDARATLHTERLIAASPQAIYAAFEDPAALARWWGPDGFTNTFEQFEFEPGGRWVLTMHGPNGTDYPNASVFRELEAARRIVIDHTSPPHFTLTVQLTPAGDKTLLAWTQAFESAEVADKLRAICEPSNEQNLDRLEAVLAAAS